MTATTFLVISGGIVAAAFVQGTAGVGFALVVAPIMAALQPALLPVCLLVLMLPLNVYFVLRERHAIDVRGTKWISVARLPGAFVGVWIVAKFAAYMNMVVGAATLLAALLSLLAPAFQPNRKAYVAAGIVTGITETATGIGGPPLALIYQHQTAPTVRATIALCFLIGELISLGLLAMAGQAVASQLAEALKFIPALIAGAFLSKFVHRRISTHLLRMCVLVFSAISGVLLLLR